MCGKQFYGLKLMAINRKMNEIKIESENNQLSENRLHFGYFGLPSRFAIEKASLNR